MKRLGKNERAIMFQFLIGKVKILSLDEGFGDRHLFQFLIGKVKIRQG